jgi:hypothetical protein
MSPFSYYFLGFLTSFIIIISFWFISLLSVTLKNKYKETICYKMC